MSIIQTVLYHVPVFWLGLIMVAGVVLLSVGGLFAVRRIFPAQAVQSHNDVAGPIFATLGVIYAVILAFMVVVAWQGFDKAETNVVQEANSLAALYRDSSALSPIFQTAVKAALTSYANAIITDEWPLMAQGKRSDKVQEEQAKLWQLYGSYRPRSETEKIFFSESVKKLNTSSELRRQRILDAHSGIHSILWFVLFAGGAITIVFTFFFGTKNFVPHLLMTSMLASLIALSLLTIMALDFPFTGDVSIKTEPYTVILQTLLSSK